MDKPDLAPQYNNLLSSPLGEDLIDDLTTQAFNKFRQAGNAQTVDKGYALTNQAEGLMLAIEHLKFRAILPKDEGSKASK